MIESRIFHFISSFPRGAAVDDIASVVFRINSGSNSQLRKIMLPLILSDKRFTLVRNKVALSDKGEKFKKLVNTTFVALDVETTGTNSQKDKITEIGALKICGGAITDIFETLINPGRYIPYDITNLTGITNEMVNNSPDLEQIVPSFLEFIGDSVLIAHNAPFDIRFINAELKAMGRDNLSNEVLCTYKLSRRFCPGLKRFSLKSMTKVLGLTNEKPHRAGSDAAACAQIFLSLLYTMPERGIFDLDDLLKYA